MRINRLRAAAVLALLLPGAAFAQHSATGRWTVRVPRNIGSRIIEVRTFAREFDEIPAAFDTLAQRVLVEEHRIYPEALAMLARGEVSFEG